MRAFTKSEPLTEIEFDRLQDFLKSRKRGRPMNVEQLDGFFAALIAGPEIVTPSLYYAEVFGSEMAYYGSVFASLDEANDILGFLTRHWNTIAKTLEKGEVYVPVILDDEKGVAHGNDWAKGFMRGVAIRPEGWNELVENEDQVAYVTPMLILCHEYDGNPQICPHPLSAERREKVIAYMAMGLLEAYRYFRRHHKANANVSVV